jgi:hypothetical protein
VTLRECVYTKVVVRCELKINRTEPKKHDISLVHTATGYLPPFVHSPGGEPSIGMAYELTSIPLNLGCDYLADMPLNHALEPFDGHGARAYLYEPVGKRVPYSNHPNIILDEQRPSARLVSLDKL